MMKKLIATLFFLNTLLTFGQMPTLISGNIFNAKSDSVYLAHVIGSKFENLFGTKIDEKGNFELKGEIPAVDYYAVRIGDEAILLFLRDNADIQIYGDGANLMSFVNIINSEESSNMFKFVQESYQWHKTKADIIGEIQKDPTYKEEGERKLASEYSKFQGQLKTFIARNRQSPALIVAIPEIDVQKDFSTFESVINQLMSAYGNLPSIKQIADDYQKIKADREANNQFAPGKPAPDFEETKPDGSTMKLSDLKGKVVLLDFWASWCGPCRRENPNVVKLYEQYKDKGFTVMSVSLDKDRQRWLDAIEKDNLSWPNHVSDLKYWSSKAAKLYGVTGIPYTVLIDAEGNIVRTKLRGEELAVELERLLGSK